MKRLIIKLFLSPVSYTHLEVFCQQVVTALANFCHAYGKVLPTRWQSLANGKEMCIRDRFSFKGTDVFGNVLNRYLRTVYQIYHFASLAQWSCCLLYTSRCV